MVTNNQHVSTNGEVKENENSWQELLGITADPPERRDKCEKCKLVMGSLIII